MLAALNCFQSLLLESLSKPGFDHIVETDAVIAPERVRLETVVAFSAFFAAISKGTLYAACIALFDGQHIQQTVDSEVCRQSGKITVSRDPEVLPTL